MVWQDIFKALFNTSVKPLKSIVFNVYLRLGFSLIQGKKSGLKTNITVA